MNPISPRHQSFQEANCTPLLPQSFPPTQTIYTNHHHPNACIYNDVAVWECPTGEPHLSLDGAECCTAVLQRYAMKGSCEVLNPGSWRTHSTTSRYLQSLRLLLGASCRLQSFPPPPESPVASKPSRHLQSFPIPLELAATVTGRTYLQYRERIQIEPAVMAHAFDTPALARTWSPP